MAKDLVQRAMIVALLGIAAIIGATTFGAITGESDAPLTAAQMSRDANAPLVHDSDLLAPSTLATWNDEPLLILRLPASLFDSYTLGATIADPSDPSLRVVAYHAKSTHLGCTVDYVPTMVENWMIDQCHQGMWNPYQNGAPRPGTPTRDQHLPLMQIAWMDTVSGRLLGVAGEY